MRAALVEVDDPNVMVLQGSWTQHHTYNEVDVCGIPTYALL